MAALRWTIEQYNEYQRKQGKLPLELSPSAKSHKFHAKKVMIDGIIFDSKWEGQCYSELKWQSLAGLITEPLLQVRFSLGVHYGRERVYVADFAHINLKTNELVVTDAKGVLTEEYKRKKGVFQKLYGICILELRRK